MGLYESNRETRYFTILVFLFGKFYSSKTQNLSTKLRMCCCSWALHSLSPNSPRLPAYSAKNVIYNFEQKQYNILRSTSHYLFDGFCGSTPEIEHLQGSLFDGGLATAANF
jgi:hypothetical protein